jgi:hypothetical protein
VAGIEVSALPAKDMSIGLERTEFVRNNTNNSVWYQNAWFRGSWADGGVALGHPLAGHGTEWRVFASGGSTIHGVSGDMSVYRRRRGDQNLYGPDRSGHSLGGTLNVDVRLNASMRLVVAAEIEGSDAWTAALAHAGLRIGF